MVKVVSEPFGIRWCSYLRACWSNSFQSLFKSHSDWLDAPVSLDFCQSVAEDPIAHWFFMVFPYVCYLNPRRLGWWTPPVGLRFPWGMNLRMDDLKHAIQTFMYHEDGRKINLLPKTEWIYLMPLRHSRLNLILFWMGKIMIHQFVYVGIATPKPQMS